MFASEGPLLGKEADQEYRQMARKMTSEVCAVMPDVEEL